MDNNYEDIILLERYLEKSLSPEESVMVEKRLAMEPAFVEALRQEKLLVNGIRFGHLKNKLKSLQDLEAGMPGLSIEGKTARVISLKPYWKVLAAAAGLAITIVAAILLNRPMTTDQLYAENFETYPNIVLPMVRGTNEQNRLTEALSAYEGKDYSRAASEFQTILVTKPSQEPEILLLLGNCNLILGKTSEARDNFITLSKDFDKYDIQAKWFLGLCYLKMGNKESARVLLEEIAAGESSYQDKAKGMLKKMK